jgi:hypothetical protein
VHLIRTSFRYAGRQHRDAIVNALKPVYTAPSEQAAKDRFDEFAAEGGARYPAIIQLWNNSWAEFVPFLEYDVAGMTEFVHELSSCPGSPTKTQGLVVDSGSRRAGGDHLWGCRCSGDGGGRVGRFVGVSGSVFSGWDPRAVAGSVVLGATSPPGGVGVGRLRGVVAGDPDAACWRSPFGDVVLG